MSIWRRPPGCADGACVEAALDGPAVLVRDSKDGGKPWDETPHLRYTPDQWHTEICSVLFLSAYGIPGPVARLDGDTFAWCGWDSFEVRQVLWFDGAEWSAFVEGVRDGRFRVQYLPVVSGAE